MLIIKLMGGLGNQLFQLFTSISYAIDNNHDYQILEFKDDKVSPLDNISPRNTYWNNILNKLYNKTIKNITQNIYIYNEPSFEYKTLPVITDKSNNYLLNGYFQSYKYFQDNLDKILKILKLDEIKQPYKNKYDYKNIVSLHFRIGDYINLQTHHPVLPIDYYINALKKLIVDTNHDHWNVLYFYEKKDKSMIDKNIEILKTKYPKLNFISIDNELDDWEQMICMSYCSHNIIANSTFSWWGAYLNTNDKRVYYPDKWFGSAMGDKNLKDLFINDWIKIEEK
jgi:hypothetical protein